MENLLANSTEAVAIILFGIGFTMLLFHRNLFRKLIGLNVMDTGVFLFLASMGYIEGRKAPIITNGIQSTEAYIRLGNGDHALSDGASLYALSHTESG